MEELLAQASQQNIMEVETYKEEVARLNQSLQRTTILVKQLEEANNTMEEEQVSFLNDIGKLEKSKNQLEEQNRRLHEMVSRLEAKL
jgi:predicted nuclease with TOPRIM domain